MARATILSLSLFLTVAAVVNADPQIAFTSDSVTVGGLTAGGKFTWYEVASVPHGYRDRVTADGGVLTADTQGMARIGNKPADGSVWIVVDGTNGAATAASPRNAAFKAVPLPAAALQHRNGGIAAGLHLTEPTNVVLYVRPGSGAWDATVEDSMPLDNLVPITGAAPPPEDFVRGDVIFVVEPLHLAVHAVTVR